LSFSCEAETDIEQIGDFIAKDSPRRACSFIRELRSSCYALSDMADSFPLVSRYERHSHSRRMRGNYLIFYRVDNDRVWIIRILYGVSDYAGILFED